MSGFTHQHFILNGKLSLENKATYHASDKMLLFQLDPPHRTTPGPDDKTTLLIPIDFKHLLTSPPLNRSAKLCPWMDSKKDLSVARAAREWRALELTETPRKFKFLSSEWRSYAMSRLEWVYSAMLVLRWFKSVSTVDNAIPIAHTASYVWPANRDWVTPLFASSAANSMLVYNNNVITQRSLSY